MAAICASSMTLRVPAPVMGRSTSRAGLRRVAVPSALKARRAGMANAGRRAMVVRAEESKFDLHKALSTYKEISYKIPPVVSATTVPVVALSLLVKTITGHGLPGTILGSIEGVAWLVFLLGAGSLLPRASSIIAGGDYSLDAMLEVLNAESDGSQGKDATSRVYNASVAKNSPLAEQMDDLKRRQAEKDSETPEEKAEREKVKAQLASLVLQNAKSSQDSYSEEKGTGKELLKQKATETIGECMTQENFDKPISEFSDDDLNDKINLSSKKGLESDAPTVVGKGDDWRMKNFQEAEARDAKAAAAAAAAAAKAAASAVAASDASAKVKSATDALVGAPSKEKKKPEA